MKPILIRPAGAISESTGKRFYNVDPEFDLLGFLVNEFDNQDIQAEVVELSDNNAHVRLSTLQGEFNRLALAARHVIACWESGDLAGAVRQLSLAVEVTA